MRASPICSAQALSPRVRLLGALTLTWALGVPSGSTLRPFHPLRGSVLMTGTDPLRSFTRDLPSRAPDPSPPLTSLCRGSGLGFSAACLRRAPSLYPRDFQCLRPCWLRLNGSPYPGSLVELPVYSCLQLFVCRCDCALIPRVVVFGAALASVRVCSSHFLSANSFGGKQKKIK